MLASATARADSIVFDRVGHVAFATPVSHEIGGNRVLGNLSKFHNA
jgi:hypothetical protein